MPRYRSVGKDHAHALGVITLNYNQFEFVFFRLFAHHFERQKVPLAAAWATYSGLPDNARSRTIRAVFADCEADATAIDHVDHALKFFARCVANRNLLFHSRSADEPPGEMRLSKTVKEDWETINHIDMTLVQLRQIADDMFTGFEYSWEVWAYLQGRDLRDTLAPFWQWAMPRTLPQKPPLPQALVPVPSPRNSATQPPQVPSSSA